MRARSRILVGGLLAAACALPPEARAQHGDLLLFGSAAQATTFSQGTNYAGFQASAGILFPPGPGERQYLGYSLTKLFDVSAYDRTTLLGHAGWRVFDSLDAGFVGGVQYLDTRGSTRNYVKPVVGAEIKYLITSTSSSTYVLALTYQAAQGASGSIAIDGGTREMGARTISLGITASFDLFGGGSRKSGLKTAGGPRAPEKDRS